MKTYQIKEMDPLARLLYWIKEREAIRRKRSGGRPAPYTSDPILHTYRFCNVRRMDDKVSDWLWRNWYEPNYDHPNMLAAVALARFVNLPESLDGLQPYVFRRWAPLEIAAALRDRKNRGLNIFNGAYMVRGNDGIDKVECVLKYYVQPLVSEPPAINRRCLEESHAALLPYYGWGSFMAGQVR
jgi:hypothetical protein